MHTLMDIILCKFAVVWSLSSHSRIFHSYGDVTIPGEGLQILTYARHSWPLSSEGSLASHNLLWHGASVYNGHLRGPVTFTPIAERLAVELSLPVFTTYVCRGWDSNNQPSACGARWGCSNPLRHRRGQNCCNEIHDTTDVIA